MANVKTVRKCKNCNDGNDNDNGNDNGYYKAKLTSQHNNSSNNNYNKPSNAEQRKRLGADARGVRSSKPLDSWTLWTRTEQRVGGVNAASACPSERCDDWPEALQAADVLPATNVDTNSTNTRTRKHNAHLNRIDGLLGFEERRDGCLQCVVKMVLNCRIRFALHTSKTDVCNGQTHKLTSFSALAVALTCSLRISPNSRSLNVVCEQFHCLS